MNGASWISLAGVVIAGGSAVWSVVSARRAGAATAKAEHYQARAEQHAERATKAAEEASVAQSESAAAARRAADALEKQNIIAEAQNNLAESVPWRFQHQYGDTYELVNESTTPKFGVTVTGESIARPVRTNRVDGRSSLPFMAMSADGMSNAIEVRWHRREDLSDDEQRWTGTKPPRSPRR